MPRKTITIGIADDMLLDQTLIEHKIKSIKNTQILFRSANGLELLNKLQHDTPDILILDLYMPFMSGWEVLTELRKQEFKGIIICTSANIDTDAIERLKTLNVTGFANKLGSNIGKAITEGLGGRPYFETTIFASNPITEAKDAEIDGREIEILNKLAEGKNAKVIADEIGGLSEKTVDTYIQNLVTRFECKNRSQLIALACYYGLIHNFESLNHLPKPKPNSIIQLV